MSGQYYHDDGGDARSRERWQRQQPLSYDDLDDSRVHPDELYRETPYPPHRPLAARTGDQRGYGRYDETEQRRSRSPLPRHDEPYRHDDYRARYDPEYSHHADRREPWTDPRYDEGSSRHHWSSHDQRRSYAEQRPPPLPYEPPPDHGRGTRQLDRYDDDHRAPVRGEAPYRDYDPRRRSRSPPYSRDHANRSARRSPGAESPPPVPSRIVPAQLRMVKLVSDVLPDPQTVAIIDSDDHGAGSTAEEGVSIGRDRVFTRRIRLASMDVSKHHATIFRTPGASTSVGGDGGWWIVDNGSAHGSFVMAARRRGDAESSRNDASITISDPPLAMYHRLSEPKVASRPYELRHGDLVRIGLTIFVVHTHVSSFSRGAFGDDSSAGARAAACCAKCQADFDGQNLIPLLAPKGDPSGVSTEGQGAETSSGPNATGDVANATTTEGSYASGSARPLAGDRKLDSEAEWKRKMKGLKGAYLGGGKGAKASANAAGGANGGQKGSAADAATVSWKKHLSSKKKRAAADDGFMVSISTAHLHKSDPDIQPSHDPNDDGRPAGAASASGSTSAEFSQVPETADSQAISAAKYVDRAAQRRTHAHSIEKTLPRSAIQPDFSDGSIGRRDSQNGARSSASAALVPGAGAGWYGRSSEHPPLSSDPPAIRASAATPLAASNRGFKLFSAIGGAGSSTDAADSDGLSRGNQEEDNPGRTEGIGGRLHQDPILARGTSGRAGLGSGGLRDVDEIANASSATSGARGFGSYASNGREAAWQRWQQSSQSRPS